MVKFTALLKNERGAIAIIAALLAIPIMAVVGFSIDYSNVTNMQAQLQSDADAAALVAAKAASQQEAETLMQSFVQGNSNAALQKLSPQATLNNWQSGQAQVTITATIPTTLSGLLGFNAFPITASSTTQSGISYLNVYLAVDMSGSLSIAADAANRATLQAVTASYVTMPNGEQGCEFACHQVDGWEPYIDPDNPDLGRKTIYQIARENNISLREDFLKTAYINFVSTFLSASGPSSQRLVDVIGFSGHTFSDTLSVDQIVRDLTGGLTSDLNLAQNALSNFPDAYKLGTDYTMVLPRLQQIAGTQGTGHTSDSPSKMLVLITDGVQSNRNNGSGTYPIDNPIDDSNTPLPSPQNCEAIKNSGITLVVLDVKYIDSTGEYSFDYCLGAYVDGWTMPPGSSTIYQQVTPALQQCASPGWYFQAQDSADIDSALTSVLDKINKSALRIVH